MRTPSFVNPSMSTSATDCWSTDASNASDASSSSPLRGPLRGSSPCPGRCPSLQVSESNALKKGILARTHLCPTRDGADITEFGDGGDGGDGGDDGDGGDAADRAVLPAVSGGVWCSCWCPCCRLTKRTSAWRGSLTAWRMSRSKRAGGTATGSFAPMPRPDHDAAPWSSWMEAAHSASRRGMNTSLAKPMRALSLWGGTSSFSV
mmetsp:Transcript_40597/g.93320  ORF Transcript_40597/g.93320 Transcript_40597/m.93320 type:complete len:205 (-) Transcript_40597:1362-1976(-)